MAGGSLSLVGHLALLPRDRRPPARGPLVSLQGPGEVSDCREDPCFRDPMASSLLLRWTPQRELLMYINYLLTLTVQKCCTSKKPTGFRSNYEAASWLLLQMMVVFQQPDGAGQQQDDKTGLRLL